MLTRILRMPMREVADRSRQQASKWMARHSPVATTMRRRARATPSISPELQDPGDLDHFRSTSPERFFAGPSDAAINALRERLAPDSRASIVAGAANVRAGRFDLLGYNGLWFGDPIDWRLDPVSGRRSPLTHWTSIDPMDVQAVGDPKVVWELSRMQFLLTLGMAYQATGDEAHAEAFARRFREWTGENPPGLGINWVSSLEVALRLITWTWALSLFRLSPHLTPHLYAEVSKAVDVHADHIERYLSHHTSPNTHLTGEALGLFYAGLVFPQHPQAARRRDVGRRILDEQLDRQVLRDGVYFEQTTAYQIYTAEIYLHYLILADRNGLPIPAGMRPTVQRMLDFLLAIRRPDGGMPVIGDQDGGFLLPLMRREPKDARGLFSVAAAFFGRADFAWAAGGIQPEALWLLGSGVVATSESTGAAPPRETSRVFPEGGYVVMRSGWRRTAHHLVFDVGPLASPLSGAHGHADLLSVVVSPFGEPVIVDPGAFLYAKDPASRNHFRGTAAHSTVTVDGAGQAEPKGPFGWRDRPAAQLRRFDSTADYDLADASHEAYARLADPVTHRRRVVFVKAPGYWVIVDDLSGASEHRIEHRFQFGEVSLIAESGSWARARGSRGRGLLVRAFASEPLTTRIESGCLAPLAGWVSQNYGERSPSPALVYRADVRLPLRIVTVLLPVEDSATTPPPVRVLWDPGGPGVGLVFEDVSQTLRFDDDGIVTLEGSFEWRK